LAIVMLYFSVRLSLAGAVVPGAQGGDEALAVAERPSGSGRAGR
jgi:hypothetical protein